MSVPENPAKRAKVLAIVSISTGGAGLLLSFISIFCCLWLLSGPLGLTGVITGFLSLSKIKQLSSPEEVGPSKGLAIAGLSMGGASMLISLLCAGLAILIGIGTAASDPNINW